MQRYKMIKEKGSNVTGDPKTKQDWKETDNRDDNGCALGGEAIGVIFQSGFIQKAL